MIKGNDKVRRLKIEMMRRMIIIIKRGMRIRMIRIRMMRRRGLKLLNWLGSKWEEGRRIELLLGLGSIWWEG